MSHVDKAKEIFAQKFNCSQAVLMSYAQELGMSEEQALKVAQCFSGGMRSGEVCGAASGALMVIGLKYGGPTEEGKSVSYQKAAEFMERFKNENGSYLCKEILECDISTPDGMKSAMDRNCFNSVCPRMVESAARILEELLN